MTFAGVDYSTHGCDVVCLNLDNDDAQWEHVQFPGGSALERARNVRDTLPARRAWVDNGVLLIAIERPMSRSQQALVPLMRTLGCIEACLPSSVPCWELTAAEWRTELGLKHNARRVEAKLAAARFAHDHWTNMPPDASQDACDAYCIGYAARQMNARALAGAA